MSKSERMDLRLTPEQKLTIERAAAIEGTTAAGYTVAAVMQRAAEAVYRAKTLELSPESWDQFTAALDANPPVPAVILELLAKPSVLER